MSDEITATAGMPAGAGRIEETQYSLYPDDYVAYMRFLSRRNRDAAWARFAIHMAFFLPLVAVVASLLLDPISDGAYGFIGTRPFRPFIRLVVPFTFVGYFFYAVILDLLLISDMMPRRFFRRLVATNYRAGLYKRGRRWRVWMTEDEFVETTDFEKDDGDGVVVGERTESRALWSAVGGVEETENHLFFRMSNSGYLIVPKRVFLDEDAARHYLVTVERLREAYLRRVETTLAAGNEAPREARDEAG